MARTAPVPDIPPIPGMCPSIAVLAGGGDGGGGSGEGAGDGSGDENAGGSGSGEGAEGDQRGAPDYTKYPECGYASHPVDVVTGRAFTHPLVDLALPGPLPLELKRMYSSKAARRDTGLGLGWAHTFGWEVEVLRRRITVWNEQGIAVDFPVIPVGGEVLGPWGWVLRRETWGFAVDADDGLWHLFSAGDAAGKRFRLTAIQDRNKNRIALVYEDERLVEITDSAGRTIRVLSTNDGRIASLQVKNAVAEGRWIAFATYAYDERGRLASATDADGFTARYGYDDQDRLCEDADRAGLTFHFRYDDEGRCVESWGDYPGQRDPSLSEEVPRYLQDGVTRVKGVHHCKFEYFPEGYSEVADSTQVRRFFGTVHGTLKKSVVGGGVMTASYRDDGHLLAHTDEVGATTSFDRDARGRILKITDPLGRTTVIERDAAGLPVTVVDPAGGMMTMARDRFGNTLVHTDPNGSVSSAKYDARGLVAEIVDARGGRTAFTYDTQGNLDGVTEPSGALTRYGFDALGRRTSKTDATGAQTRYAYSARGDLVAVYDAAGGVTRYAYNGEHRLTQQIDSKGRATDLLWGGYHRLCARRDALGQEVRLVYNVEGELICVRNERGEEHRLEHDTSGRLVAETTLDGRRLHYKLDALGRPVRITNGLGEKTVHTYDSAGQLVGRELPDGSAETFEYDPLGALTAARWSGGEIRFERDALGQIVRETQTLGDEEHSVDVVYDPGGERAERRTSLGHSESVERGADGSRRRTVLDGSHVIEHLHDPLGREVARVLPGGGRLESSFDPLGRLSRRRVLSSTLQRSTGPGEPVWLGPERGEATVEKAYRYDWNGDVIETWDKQSGRTELQYDPLGQLLAIVPEKARGEVFRYDPSGNLLGSAGAPEREYARGDRLVRKGTTSYTWDDDGRLVEKLVSDPAIGLEQRWSYRWNGAGLLEAAVGPDGTVVELSYDPLARRLEKRVSRASSSGGEPVLVARTRFVWDGDVLVHEIRRAARAGGDPVVAERTYCFEERGFEPVAHREDGAWLHYVNDPAGAPERLIDEGGRVACELQREAFGRVEIAESARGGTPLRFQGQYEDAETGLCYNRFRYYDPEVGRFTSADPMRLRGGMNAFAYGRNPISYIDPLGLLTRRQAMQRAQQHAQVPRDSRGGQDIPINDLNLSSRGRNWAALKARGETSIGRRCDPSQRPNDQSHWMDHPDGHPDAGQANIPAHHASPHIHAVNAQGHELIIPYTF